MKIGYQFYGFLGDYKFDSDGFKMSSPDGNAFYSWSIIHEFQKRGHTVYSLMPDRDKPGWDLLGNSLFVAFSAGKRASAYQGLIKPSVNWLEYLRSTIPSLDLILLEWRFPTYRNFGPAKTDPDLTIQNWVLTLAREYSVPVFCIDLDHKLDLDDEVRYNFKGILETAFFPKHQAMDRISVGIPFDMDDLKQFPMIDPDRNNQLVYIGSRYERDDIIERYISPLQSGHNKQIHFYGNWLEEKYRGCVEQWPGISFHHRVTHSHFRSIYQSAAFCPLLAKQSYFDTGFITARLLEAILFGTIPVGFKEHRGIENVLPEQLIVDSWQELSKLMSNDIYYHKELREDLRNQIIQQSTNIFSSINFVDSIIERL